VSVEILLIPGFPTPCAVVYCVFNGLNVRGGSSLWWYWRNCWPTLL